MTVEDLLSRMSSQEFSEWMEFSQIEGFGSRHEDLRAALTVQMLANIHRDREKKPEPFGLLELIPWGDETQAAREAESILLHDPKSQADLIRAAMFGRSPNGKA